MENLRLGVIGVGKMGGVIVKNVAGTVLPANQIWVTDIDSELVARLVDETDVNVTSDIAELLTKTDVILCAVPPGAVPHILPQLSLSSSQWLMSIAAGVSTATLESYFQFPPPIVRVMPNIAAAARSAISVLAKGSCADELHIETTLTLFNACGTTLVMDEQHLNAVTGVSGSGPAYVSLFIEALADAGVQVGLPRAAAEELAIHTVLGTATMLAETCEHPAVLKNRVTTPGGTTAAGLHALEKRGLRATIAEAILAATKRSKQLGNT